MIELRHALPVDVTVSGKQQDGRQLAQHVFNDIDWQRRQKQALCRFLVRLAFGTVSPETEARIRAASLADLTVWTLQLRLAPLPAVRPVSWRALIR